MWMIIFLSGFFIWKDKIENGIDKNLLSLIFFELDILF